MKRVFALALALFVVVASLDADGRGANPIAAHYSVIASWDFTTHATGFASSLPNGLLLSRASGSADSVQTGTSTLVVGGTTDYARFGRRLTGDPIGLVFEQSRTNLVPDSRNMSAGSWTAGSGCSHTTGFVGPDGGTTAERWVCVTTGLSSYQHPSVPTGYVTFSQWQRGNAGGEVYMWTGVLRDASDASAGYWTYPSGTLTTAWTHSIGTPAATQGVGMGVYFVPVDGEDRTPDGGPTAAARDGIVDAYQIESGAFATEFILTSGGVTATRAGEWLHLASTVGYVHVGRLSLEIDLRPKADPASYGAAMRFWTRGSDYCEFATTGVLTCSVGGVTNTTAAFSWAQYDSVRIYVAVGGGLASVVSYSVNGAAAVHPTVSGAGPLGSVSTGGALDFLCSGTASQLDSWITGITVFKTSVKPAWALREPANDNGEPRAIAA
jgi:hypothetical protein